MYITIKKLTILVFAVLLFFITPLFDGRIFIGCCQLYSLGEGVESNIWAFGDEDINKTIELLTGEKD